jgi:hypothetical protein
LSLDEFGVELEVLSKIMAFNDVLKICENLGTLQIMPIPGVSFQVLIIPRIPVEEGFRACKDQYAVRSQVEANRFMRSLDLLRHRPRIPVVKPGTPNVLCGINCLHGEALVQKQLQLIDTAKPCTHDKCIKRLVFHVDFQF